MTIIMIQACVVQSFRSQLVQHILNSSMYFWFSQCADICVAAFIHKIRNISNQEWRGNSKIHIANKMFNDYAMHVIITTTFKAFVVYVFFISFCREKQHDNFHKFVKSMNESMGEIIQTTHQSGKRHTGRK